MPSPLHPMVVHVPLVLSLVVPLVLIAVTWMAWRGRATRLAWIVAGALQLAVVAGGVLALRTGESEEDRVEAVVGEGVLEAHESRATVYLWGAGLLLAGLGLGIAAPRMARGLAPAAALASLIVVALGIRVGHAGGELVYRHGAAAAYTTPGSAPAGERAHDDDD